MDTFEYDPALFNPNNPFVGDDKMPVQFYMGTMPAPEEESRAAGHPIYKDVECIKIFNSKDNIIDRPVRDTDKARWPGKYNAWKATGVSVPGGGGWPLEKWPQISRAQAEEYKYFKVFTVEQLATMPDSMGQRIMGFAQLKAKAVAAIQLAKEEAPLLQMQAALEARDAKIAQLTLQLASLGEKLDQLLKKAV